MSVSPLDSSLHTGLLGDSELAGLFSDEAEIAAMIAVERALARVEGRLGVIPADAAATLDERLATARVEPAALASGMARDGVAAPALVAALRRDLPVEAGAWLHWGFTSQDLADTALVLRLRPLLDAWERRLVALGANLAALAEAHLDTPCLARTRMQAASPTLFGLKVAQWLSPLLRHRQRLQDLRPRLLSIQCGGAAGNLAALGEKGAAVMQALAAELELSPAAPWHKARDRFEELAGLSAMIAGSLGTIGADLALMAQTEVGEIGFSGAGGSSTLPQKQNPVLAEILVTLARFVAGQSGLMHQAGIHAQERDGSAWTLETLTLPPLLVATGAALRRAGEAIHTLNVETGRMRQNIEATRGLVLAEAASFALAKRMPRPEATALVKKAVEATLGSDRHLFDHLAGLTSEPIDWAGLRTGGEALSAARSLAVALLAEARAALRAG